MSDFPPFRTGRPSIQPATHTPTRFVAFLNPLNAELNPVCHLLALAGAHHFVHFSRLRVNDTQNVFYRTFDTVASKPHFLLNRQ